MKPIKNNIFGGLVMKESCSLTIEAIEDKRNITTCTLSKGYTITIPKLIRETLNLLSGEEVTISLAYEELVIEKRCKDTLENTMILNNRGCIKIPQEFINLLYLEKGDVFNLHVDNNSILLSKSNK